MLRHHASATLALVALALPLAGQVPAGSSAGAGTDLVRLDDFKVTAATRTEKLASTLPVTTTVIARPVLDRQLAISADLGQVLAQHVPSYATSRQKLTSRGESFRGRDPLYLVDGIPQSNPLRAGNRESLTIDPFFLETIEVVHGSSAAQGMGATGGLVNFVTRAAPMADGTSSAVEVSGVSSTRFRGDGYGGRLAALAAARSGRASAVVGAAWDLRPMAYDGDGRTLGVDNTQGDTLDSETRSLFGKFVFDLSARHRAELMVSHFDLAQDLRWTPVAGNRAAGVPTTSVRGTQLGEPARNRVTSAALNLHDRDLLGGELTVNLFSQNFAATYGAADTPANRTFFRFNGVPTLDQSQVEAQKHGVRTTWVRSFPELGGLGVVTGFDYLSDETAQVLILTGRAWVPFTTYEGWSPYLQLERPLGAVTLSGGVRLESATLDVPDFTTIESSNSTFVRGGQPSFDEPLLNFGLTWRVADGLTAYGSFAQGFGMADVGRILRAINTPGRDVDDFINLEPIVTDNWETGVRLHGDGWRLGWNVYLSRAELGARLVTNAAGVFDVVRERSETYGTELNAEVRLPRGLGTLGGYVALLEGKSDRNLDGRLDRRLPAVNISAPKVALHWDRAWTDRLSTRVQSLTLLPRDDPDGIPAGDFPGYTLVDLLVTWDLGGRRTLSLGIENAADRQYVTYFSRTLTGASADNFNAFAGRGRTVTLRHRWEF
jgi:iron complex outermembrane receptor protein